MDGEVQILPHHPQQLRIHQIKLLLILHLLHREVYHSRYLARGLIVDCKRIDTGIQRRKPENSTFDSSSQKWFGCALLPIKLKCACAVLLEHPKDDSFPKAGGNDDCESAETAIEYCHKEV